MVTYLHFDKEARGCVIRRVASGNMNGVAVARFEHFGVPERVLAASLQVFLRDFLREGGDKPPDTP